MIYVYGFFVMEVCSKVKSTRQLLEDLQDIKSIKIFGGWGEVETVACNRNLTF